MNIFKSDHNGIEYKGEKDDDLNLKNFGGSSKQSEQLQLKQLNTKYLIQKKLNSKNSRQTSNSHHEKKQSQDVNRDISSLKIKNTNQTNLNVAQDLYLNARKSVEKNMVSNQTRENGNDNRTKGNFMQQNVANGQYQQKDNKNLQTMSNPRLSQSQKKYNDKQEKNDKYKFFRIDQNHSSQGQIIKQKESNKRKYLLKYRTKIQILQIGVVHNNNQIYQLQGQQRSCMVRTNSLMKNFCFFTDGDHAENMKNMYDDSLVEWKKFQNSRINEPKKIQRNSNLQTKQSLYLSLGKEKKFSLRDIQKMKKEQQLQQLQQEEEKKDIKIPMVERRKSCECKQCGKLNTKQLQLQDLPFIPKQQKKVSTILAAPIRQPIRKSIKQSPPSTPKNQSKSTTHIPSQNQRRSFAYNDSQKEITIRNKNNTVTAHNNDNTSIDKDDSTNRNKRSSSRNIKWGGVQDQVSETSIEENKNYQKRHVTVVVRRSSKFELTPNPEESQTQKKVIQPKVESVLEKSVKEKSKCMQTLMNFLQKIIEKVQNEENQKQNKQGSEKRINSAYETQENGTSLHFDENDINSTNKKQSNDDDLHYSQETAKKTTNSDSSQFNHRDFQHKRSSVGDLYKPRTINVQSPTFAEKIKFNQKSEKEVIKSMETLSQFRDRYLKKFAEFTGISPEEKMFSQKKKSNNKNGISLQLPLTKNEKDQQSLKKIFQKNEQKELIDQLMVFSENHTPLLQSPYFTQMKSKEQLFDKQYNKKNNYQKVFTTSVIHDDHQTFIPSQTTRSFYHSNNNNYPSSLMNVPTLNTMTNLNQTSYNQFPLSTKQSQSKSSKNNNNTFCLKNTQSNQLQPFAVTGPNYFATQSRRNMSQNDLFLKNTTQPTKFNAYISQFNSPKNISTSRIQSNSNDFQQVTQPLFLKNGLQNNGRKNKQINGSLYSPSKPVSQSTSRIGTSQYPQNSRSMQRNDGNDKLTQIKSLKELDSVLDGMQSSQFKTKQSSLSNTSQNNRYSNSQIKVVINDKKLN